MATANQAYRSASDHLKSGADKMKDDASSTVRSLRDDAEDLADAVGKQASKQYARAQDLAEDAWDEVHDATVRNPHLSLAVALGLGFLLGVTVARR